MANMPYQDLSLAYLGYLYYRNERFTESQRAYDKSLNMSPDRPEVHYNLSLVLDKQGKPEAAKDHLRKALRLWPNFTLARSDLGMLLTEAGQFEDAIVQYRHALQVNSDDVQIRYRLAQLLAQLGQMHESTLELRAVVRVQPEFDAAHNSLGQVLAKQGKFIAASRRFQKAIELNPKNTSALNGLAWLRATSDRPELHNATEAVRLAEKACAITSYNSPLLLNTLGAAYAADGRITDAIACAQSALRLLSRADGPEELKRDIYKRLQRYQQVGH
jgi:tetratricopeptide (TPR) repeat protein